VNSQYLNVYKAENHYAISAMIQTHDSVMRNSLMNIQIRVKFIW